MHIDDLPHRIPVGEIDEMEEAAAQERVRQFFLIVTGNNDHRPLFRLNRLARLVNEEFHAIEFLQ